MQVWKPQAITRLKIFPRNVEGGCDQGTQYTAKLKSMDFDVEDFLIRPELEVICEFHASLCSDFIERQ